MKQKRSDVVSNDDLRFKGTIIEMNKGLNFKVDCVMNAEKDIHHTVQCTPSGKLQINHIRLVVGDEVVVELSPVDVNRGRIIWRIK